MLFYIMIHFCNFGALGTSGSHMDGGLYGVSIGVEEVRALFVVMKSVVYR
ncbi:MAG: hypothetical protein K2N85_12940 [Lachnospiraceae bacterium]|nr:hypothetical protein [Lachnospiraceae bacterium]